MGPVYDVVLAMTISYSDFDPDVILKGIDTSHDFGFTFGPNPSPVPASIFETTEKEIVSKEYDDWRDEFTKDGYAVIKGVLPKEKAKEYQTKAFDWATSFGTDLDMNNPKTWVTANIPPISDINVFFSNAVAHEKFMWDIRTEEEVIKPFADLYGTDDLLVSFDSLNITFPGRDDRPPIKGWPHVDQSPFKNGLQCVQGIVSLSEHGPNDGGLVVYKTTSKLFKEFFETQVPKDKWDALDVYHFSQEELDWFIKRGCEEVKICCEPGDMILWDSRTIHWGKEPESTSDVIRTVVYVSYSPRKFANHGILEYRKKAFQAWLSTSHWAHDNIRCRPNIVMKEDGTADPNSRIRPLQLPPLNSKVLSLVGFN